MPKFSVRYSIVGTMTDIIEADSQDDAERIAHDTVEMDGWEPCLDDVEVDDIYIQEMHRVVRDGKPCWTTYVRETDTRTP